MLLRFEHELPCSPARFWSGFLDTDTVRDFYRRGFGFTRFDVKQLDETAASLRRVVDCHLPVQLGGVLKPLFRNEFSFVEDGTFERATATWRYTWVPATMPSKIRIHGWIRAEPIEPGGRGGDGGGGPRCRRIGELTFDARVPVFGSPIEWAARRLLVRSWDESVVALTDWLERGLWG